MLANATDVEVSFLNVSNRCAFGQFTVIYVHDGLKCLFCECVTVFKRTHMRTLRSNVLR